MPLPLYLHEASEQIDAAIFSGDVFMKKEYREEMESLIERWKRGLISMKEIAESVEGDNAAILCANQIFMDLGINKKVVKVSKTGPLECLIVCDDGSERHVMGLFASEIIKRIKD